MNGHADILALWIKTLNELHGQVPPREFAAMKLMVDATWDACEAAGLDMRQLKGEVRKLVEAA